MSQRKRLGRWLFPAVAVVVGLTVPFVASNYALSMINLTAITIVASLGLNILIGYTGQISMGHAAFMGVGAYTAAILTTKAGLPFYLAMLVGGAAAAVAGVIFGSPSLRLKGLYLAMATLASQILLEFVFKNWRSVTGGVSGIYITSPRIFGISLGTDQNFYFLAVGAAVLATILTVNLFRTKTGRAFIAIRDRDIAAEIVGVDTFKYKLLSFAISSFYAGVAGSLWSFYMTIATPDSFTLAISIQYVAMVIIGGLGTVSGSIYGAIFVALLPQFLEQAINLAGNILPVEYAFAAIRDIIFGLLIILFLVFEPKGLAEIGRKLWHKVTADLRKKGGGEIAVLQGTGGIVGSDYSESES